MAHGLIMRAHDAEAHVAAAVAHGHCRNDGVQRPLTGAEDVGMPDLQREAGATVGKQDTGFLGADARAEIRKERIDEGHRHAVAVDHAKIDGVFAGRGRRRQLGAALKVDLAGKSLGKTLVEQVSHGRPHM